VAERAGETMWQDFKIKIKWQYDYTFWLVYHYLFTRLMDYDELWYRIRSFLLVAIGIIIGIILAKIW